MRHQFEEKYSAKLPYSPDSWDLIIFINPDNYEKVGIAVSYSEDVNPEYLYIAHYNT